MELARRTRWIALALPVALAAGTVLARPAPPGAAAAAGPAMWGGHAERAVESAARSGRAAPAWYRLDPQLDSAGTLVGQRLTVGRGDARWVVDLPPESFASTPVDGRVLVGDDDGLRSRLRAFDTGGGRWFELGEERAVIRSAVFAHDGSRVYEHRVDRATRADLGVWKRGLAADAWSAGRVLSGLAPDPAVGPTFATTLLVDRDGRLVASSCGEQRCRTRVVDTAGGTIFSLPAAGPAIGLSGGRLITLAACEGRPCPLLDVDLVTLATSEIGETDGPAVVAPGADGFVVLADRGGGGIVRIGRPGSAALRNAAALAGTAGLAPLLAASTADSGIEAPPGRVPLAPGGRVVDPSAVRFLDPATLQLTAAEVLP